MTNTNITNITPSHSSTSLRTGLSSLNMATKSVNLVQINLQHSKQGTTSLCRTLAELQTYICLIQEPYWYKGKIRGLGGCGNLHYFCRDAHSSRSCIITSRDIKVWPLLDLCCRDVTAIRTQWGGIGEVVISSAYMDRNYACPQRRCVSWSHTVRPTVYLW